MIISSQSKPGMVMLDSMVVVVVSGVLNILLYSKNDRVSSAEAMRNQEILEVATLHHQSIPPPQVSFHPPIGHLHTLHSLE